MISNELSDAAIAQLVRRFYELNLADPLLAPFFANTDQKALRAKFARLIVSGLAGASMNRAPIRRIHYRLGIGDIEFAACGKNLLTALGEQRSLSPESINKVVKLFWELEQDVVTPTDQMHLRASPKDRWIRPARSQTFSIAETASTMSTVRSMNNDAEEEEEEDEVYMEDIVLNDAAHNRVGVLPNRKPSLTPSLTPKTLPRKKSFLASVKDFFKP
jgi:truncated hemoglobin YjbI